MTNATHACAACNTNRSRCICVKVDAPMESHIAGNRLQAKGLGEPIANAAEFCFARAQAYCRLCLALLFYSMHTMHGPRWCYGV